MKNLLTAKNLITLIITAVALTVSRSEVAHASSCETNYGGGETCRYNKRFQIDKDVRIEGDNEWEEDKVAGVKEGEVVEFRIKVKNLSDDGIGSFDDMEMKDVLPDELIKAGGSGLTEEWNDFDSGDTKTFIIKVKIDSKEFDRTDNFEKCVVNKAEVRRDGDFEGSDTATVCYGNGEPTELPKTGAVSDLALVGVGLLTTGLLAKLSKKFAKNKNK
jgi:hypothetical protein